MQSEPAARFSRTRNEQRRVQARQSDIIPAIEKTAQHLFASIKEIDFESGKIELVLPTKDEYMSIRVSRIDDKTYLINVLTGYNAWDVFQMRAKSNIRQFFKTLQIFLGKSKIH